MQCSLPEVFLGHLCCPPLLVMQESVLLLLLTGVVLPLGHLVKHYCPLVILPSSLLTISCKAPPRILSISWFPHLSHVSIPQDVSSMRAGTHRTLASIHLAHCLAHSRCLISIGWGKSRLTMVSMQNSLFLCYYLFIIVLFSIWTIVTYFYPTMHLLNAQPLKWIMALMMTFLHRRKKVWVVTREWWVVCFLGCGHGRI